MEKGQPVWLKSTSSQWGWVPALVHNREEVTIKGITVLKVTLRDDPSAGLSSLLQSNSHDYTAIIEGHPDNVAPVSYMFVCWCLILYL